jgi:hypothetical protein
MKSTATISDLRGKIFHWHDGYNWTDETRVLIPYSILRFFKNNAFDDYWVQSGRPARLSAPIKARPLDFLEPRLESYLSAETRKSDLTRLEAAPVLFHSGYLTLDKIAKTVDSTNGEITLKSYYFFRLSNKEVSLSYHNNLFSIIYYLNEKTDVNAKYERLLSAFQNRRTKEVSEIISFFFAPIGYYQRPSDEKTLRALPQAILTALGFKVFTELPGAMRRLDLGLELPDQVWLIIELRLCRAEEKNSRRKKKTIF